MQDECGRREKRAKFAVSSSEGEEQSRESSMSEPVELPIEIVVVPTDHDVVSYPVPDLVVSQTQSPFLHYEGRCSSSSSSSSSSSPSLHCDAPLPTSSERQDVVPGDTSSAFAIDYDEFYDFLHA